MRGGPVLRNPRGFSLLELIVVLVIIGVVSAFVGPRLVGSMSNMNLRTASKRIAALLRYARSQAVSQGSDCVASFDFEGNRVSLTFASPASEAPGGDEGAGAGTAPEDGKGPGRPKIYPLPEGVYLKEGITAEGETESEMFSIVFLSDGGSTGGEVILVNQREKAYRIAVDFITGAVRVERHEA